MKCLSPFRVQKKSGLIVYVPCGQCIACRLNYGKLWSIRMMEELKNHSKACFVTLTYDDEHLPEDNQLSKRELQLFFKRLRKFVCKETYVEKDTGLLKVKNPIRFFACGEHGDRFGRSHYHAIIYGVAPEDKDIIEKCWKNGLVHVGTVTEDSCAYVAKYMTKKLRGQALVEKLNEDPNYQNEFVLMSRRPGIGSELSPSMIKFLQDNGVYYRKGVMSGLPRYWKEKFDISSPRLKKSLINEVNACKIIEKRLKFFKK